MSAQMPTHLFEYMVFQSIPDSLKS